MTRIVYSLLLASLASIQSQAQIQPHGAAPLLQFYHLKQTAPDSYDNGPNARPTHHFAIKSDALLTISSLKNFFLEADKEGVRIILNDPDASRFSEAMKKYQILGITAGGTGTIMLDSHPNEPFDGSLMFSGPVASYIRQRFDVTPGTNIILPAKSN